MKLLPVCVMTFVLACAGERARTPAAVPAPRPVSTEAWLTRLDREHELVGKIWSPQSKNFVAPEELQRQLAGAPFVLLGERHDNPDHHRLQARLLRSLVAAGRRPALVLEMLEVEQQESVDTYLSGAGPGANASDFGRAVRWHETSWPPFAEYQPIFEEALAAKLPIVAGNLARDTARALVKQGLQALPPERVQALRLDRPFPKALEDALARELHASHCGHLPESMTASMALAQHARDAQMAEAMRRQGHSDGAVLIAGGGHARRDRGVPYYLSLDAPGARVVSVVLQEVQHGVVDPERYSVDPSAFDFVWFTPRATDEDPCAAFAKPAR